MPKAWKRNATGLADAQQTGALSTFTLAIELANAGNGLAAAARELATCPDTGDIGTTLRPIPVLITAGATADTPDTFVVTYGAGTALAAPMLFASAAPRRIAVPHSRPDRVRRQATRSSRSAPTGTAPPPRRSRCRRPTRTASSKSCTPA